MGNYIKIREVAIEGEIRFLRLAVIKRNKRPILSQIEVIITKTIYHNCSSCYYRKNCINLCSILENSRVVQDWVKEKYGIEPKGYCITPMIIKEYKK